jgi:hypothetical protein
VGVSQAAEITQPLSSFLLAQKGRDDDEVKLFSTEKNRRISASATVADFAS